MKYCPKPCRRLPVQIEVWRRPHGAQMLEAQVGLVPACRHPARLARLVAVDGVPHHLAHEAADLLETRPGDRTWSCRPTSRRRDVPRPAHRPDGHTACPNRCRCGGRPPSARAGSRSSGAAGRDRDRACRDRHSRAGSTVWQPGIECLDHAGPHGAVAPVGLLDHADPVVSCGIVGEDGGRVVGRAVIDDDPEGGAEGLRDHAVERAAHVVGLVPARRDQDIGTVGALGHGRSGGVSGQGRQMPHPPAPSKEISKHA